MIEQTYAVPNACPDRVVRRLPQVFRLQSITRTPFDGRAKRNQAVVYHDAALLTVEWLSDWVDARLTSGSLVSIRWLGNPSSFEGAVRISRLVPMQLPEAEIDLFKTVPPHWVRDHDLLSRASALLEQLSRAHRLLFNAIFWDDRRFARFLIGPSSLTGHHNVRHGNLRHSVEVAEYALMVAFEQRLSCVETLVLTSLLHDAGKADEYQYRNGRFEMSPRGALIGHRHTVIEWIAAAIATNRIELPAKQYLALMHALSCARGAPAWLGLREPQSLDASLLSYADRLSGQIDLMERHTSSEAGFGRYHPHLRGRPYVPHAIR